MVSATVCTSVGVEGYACCLGRKKQTFAAMYICEGATLTAVVDETREALVTSFGREALWARGYNQYRPLGAWRVALKSEVPAHEQDSQSRPYKIVGV